MDYRIIRRGAGQFVVQSSNGRYLVWEDDFSYSTFEEAAQHLNDMGLDVVIAEGER